MATLKVQNSGTIFAIKQLLQTLGAEPLENGWLDPEELPFFKDMLSLPILAIPGTFRVLPTNEPVPTITNTSMTSTAYKFTTTAFAEGSDDLVTAFTLRGTKLLPLNETSRGGNMDIKFDLVRYLSEDKSPSNIKSNSVGTLTQYLRYLPFNLANDIEGDSQIKFTGTKFNSKSTEYELNDSNELITSTGTSSQTMRSNIDLNENGTYSGKVFSVNLSDQSKGTDKSLWKSNLAISSKSGFNINSENDYSGIINSIKFSITSKSDDWFSTINLTVANTKNQAISEKLGDYLAGTTTVREVAEAIFSGNDVITGSKGDNNLNGFAGNDRLIGGTGRDYFEFTSALDAASNVDRIQNFNKSGDDKILLSSEIFVGYSNADNFVLGPVALDADDRVIYDRTKGALLYDSDGNGDSQAIQFAILVGRPELTAADLIII